MHSVSLIVTIVWGAVCATAFPAVVQSSHSLESFMTLPSGKPLSLATINRTSTYLRQVSSTTVMQTLSLKTSSAQLTVEPTPASSSGFRLHDSFTLLSPSVRNFHNSSNISASTQSAPSPTGKLPYIAEIYPLKNSTSLVGISPKPSGSPKLRPSKNTTTFAEQVVAVQEYTLSRLVEDSRPAKPRVVFAHFMLGNVAHWTLDRWKNDILQAQWAHIDAFALNMAFGEEANTASLDLAFAAAGELEFKLAFSFDYAGNGSWPKPVVLDYIKRYAQKPAYYRYNEQPFMSTFEGWENADDWVDIKAQTGIFFMPDWSSRGAMVALQLADGVADGLFSWAAWPWGNQDMNTYVDASYRDFLGQKPYMMPVSPWFYTNMPGFDKNWLWRGDSLWFDRWEQVPMVDPEFVQIISWNDYGECHYIGPLDDGGYGAFDRGYSPFNYVTGYDHDAWRLLLPYTIDTYKNGYAQIETEILTYWYRLQPRAACETGGTTGNTASQLLLEFSPREVAQDMIFYSVLAISEPQIGVSVGGVALDARFQDKPSGGIGIYHGSVETGGRVGDVLITIDSGGVRLVTTRPKPITTNCVNGIENWNAFTGAINYKSVPATRPALATYEQKCIRGTGVGIFTEMCTYTCEHGYCPIGACQCFEYGPPPETPATTGIKGYPAEGMSASFDGLCDFGCNLGFCPTNVCDTVKHPPVIWTTSPFLPPACTKGSGTGNFAGLCSFGCDFGYCPMAVCSCDIQGTLDPAPAYKPEDTAFFLFEEDDHGLCDFACTHGWCPSDVCGPEAEIEDPYPAESAPDLPACPVKDYDNLDTIQLEANTVPEHCLDRYIVDALSRMLPQAVTTYETFMRDDYDEKFRIYAAYAETLVRPALLKFMAGEGRHFFSCKAKQDRICCSECQNAACGANCFPDLTVSCVAIGTLMVVDCPNAVYDDAYSGGAPPAYQFTLIDRAGFVKALLAATGVGEEDLRFGDHRAYLNNCWQNPNPGPECSVIWTNFPDVSSYEIPNPKEIFSNSLPALNSFIGDLAKMPTTFTTDTMFEVAESAAVPVFMAQQAIESMKMVVEKAGEILQAEKLELILFFVSSLLMFVPIGGPALSRAGYGALGKVLSISTLGGEAALTIYGLVEDPKSAIFLIFAALFVARDFSTAASVRRGMSDEDIDLLGTTASSGLRKVDDIRRKGFCPRKEI